MIRKFTTVNRYSQFKNFQFQNSFQQNVQRGDVDPFCFWWQP